MSDNEFLAAYSSAYHRKVYREMAFDATAIVFFVGALLALCWII